jgi:hypothetical protein
LSGGEEALMSEDRVKNWNEDKPWSEMDLFDLQNNVARGDLVEETADFLCGARMRCARRSMN